MQVLLFLIFGLIGFGFRFIEFRIGDPIVIGGAVAIVIGRVDVLPVLAYLEGFANTLGHFVDLIGDEWECFRLVGAVAIIMGVLFDIGRHFLHCRTVQICS